MKRRSFLKGMMVLGSCQACASLGIAGSGHDDWSYKGRKGPEHWGKLSPEFSACSAGSRQSPIDIKGTIKADVEPLNILWQRSSVKMVNNGHTIQVNVPPGNMLIRSGKFYELLQFHFHAPSEHTVDGKSYPMEVHFVHREKDSDNLAVLAVFMQAGMPNVAFGSLAAQFPMREGEEVQVGRVSPRELLPVSLEYWRYEGSLTTPPCSEIVTWLVARQPVRVDGGDIMRFVGIYNGNSRPVVGANRRFILSSI
ncbi:carbonic anhydrase [Rhizobium sp. L1K21]|uniref:carbonic anhydrase n=1 Tax=Rhizobium sp. L1K21 TaxID=2954933 RepID=UPI002092B6F6|nr:carbonic anhydrase [Rhizobium sp. L1K21]MCO6186293.1 carbonic anhydrase [Rhizobium sp. L1K21]